MYRLIVIALIFDLLFFQMAPRKHLIDGLSLTAPPGFGLTIELSPTKNFKLKIEANEKKSIVPLRASPLLTNRQWVQLTQRVFDHLKQYKSDCPTEFKALTTETTKDLLFRAGILDRSWYEDRSHINIAPSRKILLNDEFDIETIAAAARLEMGAPVDAELMDTFRAMQRDRSFYIQSYLNDGLSSAIEKGRQLIDPYADAALSLLFDENTTVEDMNAFGKRNLALFGGKALGMDVNKEFNCEYFNQERDIILSIGKSQRGGGGKAGFTTFAENANLPTKMFHIFVAVIRRNKLRTCPFAMSVKVNAILCHGNNGRGRLWLAKGNDVIEIRADDIEEEFKRGKSLFSYVKDYTQYYL